MRKAFRVDHYTDRKKGSGLALQISSYSFLLSFNCECSTWPTEVSSILMPHKGVNFDEAETCLDVIIILLPLYNVRTAGRSTGPVLSVRESEKCKTRTHKAHFDNHGRSPEKC